MQRGIAIVFAVFLVGFGASAESSGQSDATNRMNAADRSVCELHGGMVLTDTLLGSESCVRPMRDAGKSCTDGSQCDAGQCHWDETGRRREPRLGEKTVGKCPATNSSSGCTIRIIAGKATGAICFG